MNRPSVHDACVSSQSSLSFSFFILVRSMPVSSFGVQVQLFHYAHCVSMSVVRFVCMLIVNVNVAQIRRPVFLVFLVGGTTARGRRTTEFIEDRAFCIQCSRSLFFTHMFVQPRFEAVQGGSIFDFFWE